MPAIIDYSLVLSRMTAAGFRCNYYNSGAFGFPGSPLIRGWIGPPDASIKPELLPNLRFMPQPFESNLTQALLRVRQSILPGPAWLMPMNHWHFELHDGSSDWMSDLLQEIQVDPKQLENRADGSAIEFAPHENKSLEKFVQSLLMNLRVSDFLLAFPGHPVLCIVHHHKQLWWTTSDAELLARLDAVGNPPDA